MVVKAAYNLRSKNPPSPSCLVVAQVKISLSNCLSLLCLILFFTANNPTVIICESSQWKLCSLIFTRPVMFDISIPTPCWDKSIRLPQLYPAFAQNNIFQTLFSEYLQHLRQVKILSKYSLRPIIIATSDNSHIKNSVDLSPKYPCNYM